MSQADLEILEWLDTLTEPQIRALAHQIGVAGILTYPYPKLREYLRERKRFNKVRKVYNEHYDQK